LTKAAGSDILGDVVFSQHLIALAERSADQKEILAKPEKD